MTPHIINQLPLDNPIWSSLTQRHRSFGQTQGLAARYPADVSPLAGVASLSPRAFADLRALVAPRERVALFTTGPIGAPDQWRITRAGYIDQMICDDPRPTQASAPLRLSAADVPEMLALTAATEPGPFAPRTIDMGEYYGVRGASGALLAMAGQRLSLDGFTEISAVCTAPEARGQGHARSLLNYLIGRIRAEGKTPFLHVKTENGAKVLYRQLGFRVRIPIQYTVLTRTTA